MVSAFLLYAKSRMQQLPTTAPSEPGGFHIFLHPQNRQRCGISSKLSIGEGKFIIVKIMAIFDEKEKKILMGMIMMITIMTMAV